MGIVKEIEQLDIFDERAVDYLKLINILKISYIPNQMKRMSKKIIFSVAFLLLISCVAFLFTRGFSGEEIQVSNNTASLEVAEKAVLRPAVDRGDHTEEKEVISPPEKIMLNVNDLLDDSDRTDKNQAILNNYSNLLFATSRYVYEQPRNGFTLETTKDFLSTLIFDARLYERISFENANFNELEVLNLDEELIVPTTESKYLPDWYLEELEELLTKYKKISTIGQDAKFESFSRTLFQVMIERKKHSNAYMYSFMKNYYTSDEYSIDQKVAFTNKFVLTNDASTSEMALRYFESIKESDNQSDKKINSLINRLKKADTNENMY